MGRSEELLPSLVLALLDETLDLLGTCASGDKEGIRHVHNDKVVHTKQGNETARSRYDDTTSYLFSQNCSHCQSLLVSVNNEKTHQDRCHQEHGADLLRRGSSLRVKRSLQHHPILWALMMSIELIDIMNEVTYRRSQVPPLPGGPAQQVQQQHYQ